MRWYKWAGLTILTIIGLGASFVAKQYYGPLNPQGVRAETELRAKVAAQDEGAFYRPRPQSDDTPSVGPLRNVYFGDLHIHTSLSRDSYLFGNRLGPDDAYRIAKGESAEIATGERVELSRPLDFAALTDHAEGFGVAEGCAAHDLSRAARRICDGYEEPSLAAFMAMRSGVEQRPLRQDLTMFKNDDALARAYAASTWQQVKDAAERHYEPGVFTTFAGYEYSPSLPDRGKHHRNIIFRSMQTPNHAISAFDAASEIDLWTQLEATCSGDCRFLTIPHNPNKSWGLAFASETIDGIPYTDEYWRLRERSEPLVEIFQIKGNSECSTAFGAADEECGMEQFLPVCQDGQVTSCIFPTSMARDGLHKGLALEDSLDFNPLRFGFIGSTDAHNANPGDTEEWDYRGSTAYASSPAERRIATGPLAQARGTMLNNPGGLAAVWAEENTREALFDAMTRREVYATSGTRIKLRTFAGYNFPSNLAETANIAMADDIGVPMGGVLDGRTDPFSIFVWALRDPMSAPLAKIQIIKGWIEHGERQERVFDIACAGSDPDPVTGRCQSNGASVDLSTCRWDETLGAPELRVTWQDPEHEPGLDAFYYVRVVQNPTCRWTTYDSLRLGRAPPKNIPATVTEMAWASPVWVKATSD